MFVAHNFLVRNKQESMIIVTSGDTGLGNKKRIERVLICHSDGVSVLWVTVVVPCAVIYEKQNLFKKTIRNSGGACLNLSCRSVDSLAAGARRNEIWSCIN